MPVDNAIYDSEPWRDEHGFLCHALRTDAGAIRLHARCTRQYIAH